MRKISMIAMAGILAMSAVPAFAATKITASYGPVATVKTGGFTMTMSGKTFTVTTTSKVKVLDKKSKTIAWSAVKKGDKVWVWGIKNTTKKTITGATQVKDMTTTK